MNTPISQSMKLFHVAANLARLINLYLQRMRSYEMTYGFIMRNIYNDKMIGLSLKCRPSKIKEAWDLIVIQLYWRIVS